MNERTVEDLRPGDVLDLASYGRPGTVMVLLAVRPPRHPGDTYRLTYQVVDEVLDLEVDQPDRVEADATQT